MVGLILFVIAAIVVIDVFFSKVGDIGKEKSQTISMVSKSELLYNMTWTLLPVHKFSDFLLYEVDRRMRCFGTPKDTDVCMEYCQSRFFVKEGVTDLEAITRVYDSRFRCYDLNGVPL